VQIDAHVELASPLRLSASVLNTFVKNHEEIKSYCIQCGPFSKQQKSLKHLPLEKLESALAAWCKQACESNAFVDGTHLKAKKPLQHHHLSGNRFKRYSNIYRTLLSDESRSVDPETVEDWKNY
jgi:hypothetical protein